MSTMPPVDTERPVAPRPQVGRSAAFYPARTGERPAVTAKAGWDAARQDVVRAGVVVTLVVAMLLVLLPASPPTVRVRVDAGMEAQFVDLINQARSDNGVGRLGVASDMVAVARDHSLLMGSTSNLHHNPDLGSDVQNWTLVGENVGYGSRVSSLFQAFMNSPGHRANILESRFTQIGVGVQVIDGRIWVTQLFRRPASPTASSDTSSGSTSGAASTADVAGGIPIWGDWDGDSVSTPGKFDDGVFTFASTRDGSGTTTTLRYGQAGDKSVVGDWDGDGVDTVGVVRGNLFILRNEYRRGAEDIVLAYGQDTDKPVVGDWDGDGRDTIGVVRGNVWILRNEYKRGAEDIIMQYGQPSDVPVTGDWDGDGTDTLGVVRDNLWILRNRYVRGAEDILMEYGAASDRKVTGDYNGDGRDTLGIVRGDLWVLRSEYRRGAEDLKFTF